MASYQVYVETSAEALSEGGYIAHVPALPGCVGRGPTMDAALAEVRSAIEQDLARSRSEGLPVPGEDEPIDLAVTETDDPTLPTDYAPLTNGDLEDLVRREMRSRQALLDLIATLPDDALDWRPGDDEWPIRWVLSHVASADLWYGSRLEDDSAGDLAWRLGATRSLLLERLRDIPDESRGRVTTHGDERWTPRKVARRMLEHEREHLRHVEDLLEAYLRSRA